MQRIANHGSSPANVIVAIAVLAMTSLAFAAGQPAPPAATVASGEPAAPVATTTLERIRAAGKLVLGYRADGGPMSYRDASGQAAGYAVAVCEQVVGLLKTQLRLPGLAVEWVAVDGTKAVQQGNVDLLCAGEAATLTQRANVSFSIPIFPGGAAALLRADASEKLQDALEERPPPYQPLWRGSAPKTLDRRTFSVIAGTPAVDRLAAQIAKFRIASTIAPVDSYEAGVARVLDRTSDVLFGDRVMLLDAAKHSAAANELRVLTRHYTFEPLALALKRNDDDFRLAVDRALSDLYASPEFSDLYSSAFGAPDADTVAFFRATAVPK